MVRNEGPTRVDHFLARRFKGTLSLDLDGLAARARERGDIAEAIAIRHELDRRLAWAIGADRLRALRGGR